MAKYVITTLLTLVFCLLSAGCGKDGEGVPPQGPFDRTVLIYMSGENNLSGESIIRKELAEMRKGSHGIGNNALVLYVDDSSRMPPYIIRLSDGVTVDSLSLGRDTLSSSPDAMRFVLDYTSSRYPAGEYGLVLWGHGSGWVMEDSVALSRRPRRAYGMDNGRNSMSAYLGGKWMNLPTLSATLASWGRHLRFILADCCLFQSVECAYELRGVADYLIGSPAEIPGDGAPYDTMTKAMFSRSDSFCLAIADAYFAQKIPFTYQDGNWTTHRYDSQTPLSVVRTSELPRLALATNKVLHSFLPREGGSPFLPLDGLIYYGAAQQIRFYDMNDVMLRYADSVSYSEWKEAFDRAVIYRRYGREGWMTNGMVPYSNFANLTDERYGGISMYVPQTSRYATPYQEYITHMGWYYAAGLHDFGW